MTRLFAGVDGGGSKTTAVVIDEAGHELGRHTAGASNYQATGLEAAWASVQAALAGALTAAGEADATPENIILGLAGIDRQEDFARWQAHLVRAEPLAGGVELCNDADLVLYALPNRTGLGLIAGTGSIALGRDEQGRQVRAGGWGHFIGDEGSGLWLGREALNAVSRASDGRGPATALTGLILEAWGLRQPSDLIGAVYGSSGGRAGVDNPTIARLAGLVFEAARNGDDLARLLLKNATNELALTLKACDTRLFFADPPGLAVAGGLLLNYPEFLTALTRRLEAMMTLGPVIRVEDAALVAARAARQV